MSSLQKLITFFKENQHEIVDYWMLDEQIKWIKIISKRSGEIYMINVFAFRLKLEKATNQYLLQDCVPEDDTIKCIFKNLKNFQNRFIVIYGNEVYESDMLVYRATNLPKIKNMSLYMVIDLEWFYDNIYVVSHEIDRSYQDIVTQTQEYIQKTTKHVSSFIKEDRPIVRCITNLLTKFDKHRNSLQQCKNLFTRICKDESETNISLYKIDDSIHPGDMTFKSAVHRQYSRKKYVDKLEKLEHLKTGSIVNMNYFFNLQWNYLLQVLIFCLRIGQLMENILTTAFIMEKL